MRASSRDGKVQVTSERGSKHFWQFLFLSDVKFFFVFIQRKGNELDLFNVITEKGTLRCLLHCRAYLDRNL